MSCEEAKNYWQTLRDHQVMHTMSVNLSITDIGVVGINNEGYTQVVDYLLKQKEEAQAQPFPPDQTPI